MKRCIPLLVIALVVGGFATVGCDDSDEPDDTAAEQQHEDDEAELEAAADEEPEFDEDDFILAAYEIRCVERELEDGDEVDDLKEAIYARYDFTEASFARADEHFAGDEAVELQIDTRLERCDEEGAAEFADRGTGETEESVDEQSDQDEAARAPGPPPAPAVTGEFQEELRGGNFEDTHLQLRIRSNFNIGGELRGERNGTTFLIPISGEVSEDDVIEARGDRGAHSIELTGQLDENGAQGQLSGQIAGDDVRMRFDAR